MKSLLVEREKLEEELGEKREARANRPTQQQALRGPARIERETATYRSLQPLPSVQDERPLVTHG